MKNASCQKKGGPPASKCAFRALSWGGRLLWLAMRAAVCLVAFLVLVLIAYRTYMEWSMYREKTGRLRDGQVREALAEVRREGENGLPPLLFLHGFAGSPADFHPLLRGLPGRYTVHAPVMPGHAAHSPRALARVSVHDWEAWAIEQARELAGGKAPPILVGFSYGGTLALRIAQEIPVEALILINPYTGVPDEPYYVLPVSLWQALGTRLTPYVRKIRVGQIDDPAGRERYVPSYWNISLDATHRMHNHASRIVGKAMPLDVPLFLHISRQDIVSDPDRMAELGERLAVPDDAIWIWEQSNHVLLYDYDAPQAIKHILQTIDQLMQAHPASCPAARGDARPPARFD